MPDGVLVASFNASTAGALNLKISMSREGGITTSASAKDDKYAVTLVGSSGQSLDDDPIRWTGQARFAFIGGALVPSIVSTKRVSPTDIKSRHRYCHKFNAGYQQLNSSADVLRCRNKLQICRTG